MSEHHYRARLSWSGSGGAGTTSYESYGDATIRIASAAAGALAGALA